MNARPRNACPARRVNLEPLSYQLRGPWRDRDHEHDGRQDRGSSLERVVAQHVLEVLLVDEGDAHERAEHDDAGDRGHPEGDPGSHLEVVERVRRTLLAEHEQGDTDGRDHEQAEGERLQVGHRDEVEAQR